MTQLYYLDNNIISDKIKEYCVSTQFSQIRIGNETIKKNIDDVLGSKKNIKVIDNIDLLTEDSVPDEILLISSSVFSKNLSNLFKFLEFAGYSMINTFWGHNNCFVYKGDKNRLISYLKENRKKDIYFVNFPEFIIDLTSLPELKSLLSNNHDSRHFNDLKSVGDLYVKKSMNFKKLKTEYEFLANVPLHLKNYYVEVFEYKQYSDFSQYSMVSYDYKDVSYLYLSKSLTEDSFKALMSLIHKYFKESKKVTTFNYEKNSFESLLEKNNARLRELEGIQYYEELNSFIKNFKGISITDHYQRIQDELTKRKSIYYEEEYIFSHGDLCFSNILFSEQNMDIKLIDPKGYENKGMRSPYYDMAKISHSIFGNYDLIINNMAEINFNENMHAFLNFTNHDYIKNYIYSFENLVLKMKMNIKLIRLIESSLFLSMIPLHYENKRKAFMLCLRSIELYEDFLS
ncbi:hypothetical protein [uncultured Maribacter sp.]|uniref:hypothetical protein n=1 Tax=uncultured Maribacter sp. TaxID=431308 RepID=UPI0030EF5794|tara:strand:- start:32863 stop:34236 length:1374 start_codon:yes stop_codon:yes gene_type:complete